MNAIPDPRRYASDSDYFQAIVAWIDGLGPELGLVIATHAFALTVCLALVARQ